VTILRGGILQLGGVAPDSLSDGELVEAMVGRTVPPLPAERCAPRAGEAPILSVEGVTVPSPDGRDALVEIDLTIAPGEIVGVAGVAGNGQRELLELALGLRDHSAGAVVVCGDTVRSVRDLIAAGVGAVPEDPVEDSVVPGLTIAEHVALGDLPSYRKRLGIDWAKVRRDYDARNAATGLRAAAPDRIMSSLSGGNIQRVLLLRELGRPASMVGAAYPCRGLDVATTRRTQELLLEQRSEGAAVLLVSEDLDELFELSDRIAVMHNGHLVGIVEPTETDRYEVGRMMLGEHEPEPLLDMASGVTA
jgi:simple sugar transport system ATP-binding protein